MKHVELHTDGGCRGNQSDTNTGGWGAVLIYQSHVKELYGGEKNTTNNIMELTAVIEGLRQLTQKNLQIDIYSDSAYVVNCFKQQWYVKWRTNGWKNSKKETVENKELWMTLIDLVESFDNVTFYKIKGHLDANKTSDVTKWYNKFKSTNQLNVDRERFLEISAYNHKADELANKGIDEVLNEDS